MGKTEKWQKVGNGAPKMGLSLFSLASSSKKHM
jgi:hypothetical protein